jgi:hypothetical protein
LIGTTIYIIEIIASVMKPHEMVDRSRARRSRLDVIDSMRRG